MDNGRDHMKKENIKSETYTHVDYRSVGIAHVLDIDQKYEFYYRGKMISKEKADDLVKKIKKTKSR